MGGSITHKTLVIKPGQGMKHYWKDLWDYRELFVFLAWRDILVRYKQTIIGVLWAVIRPLLTMVVFTVIFGNIAKLPSGGVPYPILVFVGMLPWQFFSSSITLSSGSIISNAQLITKVYFPRLVIPTSGVIVGMIDFLVSFFILIILMLWYHYVPSWLIVTLPFFILIAFVTALGAGLWLCPLNVRYRDFGYVIPFIVQFGLYVSPVGFSSNVIPEKWRLLYSINPMVGVIDGFRWAILGGENALYLPGFFLSVILALTIFVSGIWYFRKSESKFADII